MPETLPATNLTPQLITGKLGYSFTYHVLLLDAQIVIRLLNTVMLLPLFNALYIFKDEV